MRFPGPTSDTWSASTASGTRSSIALQGTLAGQWSPDVLPAAEKFYLGGARWNRGYYSGQVTGDTALSAALELQYNTGFAGTVFGKALDVGTQFYDVPRDVNPTDAEWTVLVWCRVLAVPIAAAVPA